jgi:hypothetical protein
MDDLLSDYPWMAFLLMIRRCFLIVFCVMVLIYKKAHSLYAAFASNNNESSPRV